LSRLVYADEARASIGILVRLWEMVGVVVSPIVSVVVIFSDHVPMLGDAAGVGERVPFGETDAVALGLRVGTVGDSENDRLGEAEMERSRVLVGVGVGGGVMLTVIDWF
jgi:hypothetical protein